MRTWDEIRSISENIAGAFSENEAYRLYSLAVSLPSKSNIVEIGSYLGRSSVILGIVAKDYSHNLICIDPFITAVLDGSHAKAYFIRNMKNAGTKYKLYDMKSNDVAQIYNKKVDLLFIDGNHLYHDDKWGGVKDDCENWIPKVKNGGWILFHDYKSSWEAVKRAVDETRGLEDHGLTETMIVKRKV